MILLRLVFVKEHREVFELLGPSLFGWVSTCHNWDVSLSGQTNVEFATIRILLKPNPPPNRINPAS